MKQIHLMYSKTRIGEMILGSFEGRLCLMDFRYRRMRQVVDNRIKKGLEAEFCYQEDEVLTMALRQLDEYLDGVRRSFDIPLLMVGTDFQQAVWQALLQVQYGTTVTYSGLAKAMGQEHAVRAVAAANGANAIAIMIPCHRVLGSDGELTGYGGGLAVKKRLLKLESQKGGRDAKSTF